MTSASLVFVLSIKNSSAPKASDRKTIEGQCLSSMNWELVQAKVLHYFNIKSISFMKNFLLLSLVITIHRSLNIQIWFKEAREQSEHGTRVFLVIISELSS